MDLLILSIVILFILFISVRVFDDFLAPSCLVCESFLLGVVCLLLCRVIYGSELLTILHVHTLTVIALALLAFLGGSLFAYILTRNECNRCEAERYIIVPGNRLVIMLLVQIIILAIYLYYYQRVIEQFGGMRLSNMMRAYRFTAAYGEGTKASIPMIVNQMIKIPRSNAYVSLYILMHNIALKKHLKKRIPNLITLVVIVLLYIPYNLTNAARFDLFILLSMSIVIWYTYFRNSYKTHDVGRKASGIALRKIIMVVVLSMFFFSFIAPFVGRLKSTGILTQSIEYFGRPMQALDSFLEAPSYNTQLEEKESFYGLIKLLKQAHILSGSSGRFYLEFKYNYGFSLGNTYTSIRRYYADYGICGVLLFPFLLGYISTSLYIKSSHPQPGHVDYRLIIYASIVHCLMLYCYEEFFFSTVLSFNYVAIFVCLWLVVKWINGESRVKIRFNNKANLIRQGETALTDR